MSLLLDALKRAEQEKLARGGEAPAPPPPPPTAMTGPRAVPAAPNLELQPLGGPPPGAAAAHAAPAPGKPGGASQAQAMFAAKAESTPPPRGRGMVWATAGAIAVVVIAAAAYVWYSVKALTPQPRQGVAVRPITPPPPAAQAQAAPAPLPSAAIGGASRIAPPPADPPRPAPAAEPPAAPAAATPAPAPAADQEALAALARQAAAQPPPGPLKLDRSVAVPPRIPAEVASGYEALRTGDLAAARRSYEAALAADAASLDAQLGLATVEARSGNRAGAALHYRRALAIDPRNATALAGLAALADFSRPEALEAQLRADIARLPDSAALRFTLGNLYASRGRWSEAQAEYFEAHRLDPGGADIAFNLAVSLDHLGQARAAAGFYRRALEAARGQAAQFDPAAAARRLAEIR